MEKVKPDREDVDQRIARVLVEMLGTPPCDVTPDKHLMPPGLPQTAAEGAAAIPDDYTGNLGADSLDVVEIVICLEEEFAIEIADDEVETVKTVRDVGDLVERKLDELGVSA
jgi:acyl carrier protein